jgi:two-component system LytT family response regulator
MIKAIIVDDEVESAELLQLKLARFCPSVQVRRIFTVSAGVTDFVGDDAPDVVFLDIEMPGMDGLNIARKIKGRTEIVFVTAFDKYSIEALRITVLDYLLKPVQEDDLKSCIARLEEKLQQKRQAQQAGGITGRQAGRDGLRKINAHFDKIALHTLEGVHFLPIRDIIRIESESNYSVFFFDGRNKIVVSKTLKQVEEQLEPYNFFRPHRSHLINIDHLTTYTRGEGGTVTMTDGSKVEVSRMKKKELLGLLGLE